MTADASRRTFPSDSLRAEDHTGEASLKRILNILIAEPESSQRLRKLILQGRRIRYAGSEQECLDLAYAGSADILLLDLDDARIADPDFVSRVRFVSRHAFPILGVSARREAHAERWFRNGLSDLLTWDGLTPYRLDRSIRHWVRFHRMQRRLFDADRRALQWWKDLVQALDEVRQRLERSCDALDAFLNLLEGSDGEVPALREQRLLLARKQVAELNQVSADLDFAARVIQLKGFERSRKETHVHRPAVKPDEWLADGEEGEPGERSIDPGHGRDSHNEERRYGT